MKITNDKLRTFLFWGVLLIVAPFALETLLVALSVALFAATGSLFYLTATWYPLAVLGNVQYAGAG